MNRNRLTVIFTALFTWLLSLLAGALLFDTFVLYPNIFYDVPLSLAEAVHFLRSGSPGKFFPPFGGLILFTGVVTLIVSSKNPRLFICMAISFVVMFLGEFIFSALFFWPRNTIMFTEGLEHHSSEELIRVAAEFRNFHWLRLAGSVASSSFAQYAIVTARHSGQYSSN